MRNKTSFTRFYNVLFPVWFFFFYPSPIWLGILAGNFLIDLLVVYFTARKLQVEDPKEICRKSIFKVCVIGFCADFIGAAFLFLMFLLAADLESAGIRIPFDIGRGFCCILFSLPGMLLSAYLIYRLNKRFSFNDTSLKRAEIRRLSFSLALFTAPYLMLLPTYW